MTAIEWTDVTWNPTTGCDRVSPGCDHCYAMTLAPRLKAMGSAKYQRDGDPRTSGPGFGITEHPGTLDEPLRWRKPRRVFVNSMSDLFHDGVSDGFIARVWDVMAQTPQHTYQILTKRHARMRSWVTRWADLADDREPDSPSGMPPMPRGPEAVRATYTSGRARLFADMLDSMGEPPEGYAHPLYDWMEGQRHWPRVLPNVWLGVSVEDQKRADLRIPALLDTPAAVRFLSCEPLLGPVDLGRYAYDEDGLGWVIAGGESGPGARPMHPDWPRQLRDQCTAGGVPFFFKQWGAYIPKDHTGGIYGGIRDVTRDGAWSMYDRDRTDGAVPTVAFAKKYRHRRELDGRTWDEFPAVAS